MFSPAHPSPKGDQLLELPSFTEAAAPLLVLRRGVHEELKIVRANIRASERREEQITGATDQRTVGYPGVPDARKRKTQEKTNLDDEMP